MSPPSETTAEILEKKLKEMQRAVEELKHELQQTALGPEKLLETTNRLKADIIRLQAEREWLLQIQLASSPKSTLPSR